jgi:hypothetical protein
VTLVARWPVGVASRRLARSRRRAGVHRAPSDTNASEELRQPGRSGRGLLHSSQRRYLDRGERSPLRADRETAPTGVLAETSASDRLEPVLRSGVDPAPETETARLRPDGRPASASSAKGESRSTRQNACSAGVTPTSSKRGARSKQKSRTGPRSVALSTMRRLSLPVASLARSPRSGRACPPARPPQLGRAQPRAAFCFRPDRSGRLACGFA